MPPIRFEVGRRRDSRRDGRSSCAAVLDGMRDRRNVRLHLVGHADTQPLSPALARVFGDNEGLSRERAGEVAELLQRHARSAGRGHLVRVGRRSAARRVERDGGRPRAEPARRGRGLVRRGRSKARRSTRCSSRRSSAESRSAASRGLPAALRRRQRAAHARAERRRAAALRRRGRRGHRRPTSSRSAKPSPT